MLTYLPAEPLRFSVRVVFATAQGWEINTGILVSLVPDVSPEETDLPMFVRAGPRHPRVTDCTTFEYVGVEIAGYS